MGRAGVVTWQILGSAAGLAAICGLVGILLADFAGWGDTAQGLGWGMVIGGAVVGFAAAGTGSPTETLAPGRSGSSRYWVVTSAMPHGPLQLAFGGALTFAAGVALLVLTYE